MAMGQKTVLDVEPEQEKEKKLDLSAAQVAGSSLATVAAALLASQMGVYGTILGAGVVSVVATAGGPVIQHFFRRTGDQLRETTRPKARQVPVDGPGSGPVRRAPDGTMLLGTVPAGPTPGGEYDGEFGEATVHGRRMRGWKRTAVASGAAFAIALGGLGTYEAVAGTSVSADGKTLLTGGVATARDHKPDPPKDPSGTGTGTGEKGGKTPDTGNSPNPSHSKGDPSPKPDPDPSPSPDPTPKPTPTPTPTPKPDPTPTPPPTPSPGTGSYTPSAGAGAGGESPAP